MSNQSFLISNHSMDYQNSKFLFQFIYLHWRIQSFMFKTKNLFVLLLFFTLILLSEANRGRKEGKNSHSKQSQKDRLKNIQQNALLAKKIAIWFFNKQVGKLVQTQMLKYPDFYESCIVIIFIAMIILTIFAYFELWQRWMISKFINSKPQPCTLSIQECEKKANQFKLKKWNIYFKNNLPKSKQTCGNFIVTKLSKQNNFKYKIQLRGLQDSQKKYSCFGVLIFFGSCMGIYFFKQYPGKQGSFWRLMYEGISEDGEQWLGIWAYHQQRTENQYVGTWRMEAQVQT